MHSFWIKSRNFDFWWFIAPMLLPPLLVGLIPGKFLAQQETDIFPWSWILIVLTIDVAHVYSTVYKTYFNPLALKRHKLKLYALPIIVWIAGALVYSQSTRFFWSVVAYFAVFHFIRQQYGFFRLYSIKSIATKSQQRLLNLCIYSVMVIPIAIWHVRGQRNFNWMTEGDFFYLSTPSLEPVFQVLFLIVLVSYLALEVKLSWKSQPFNFPRVLLTFATGISYYTAIVLTNNDFLFSLINVVGHGIPYMALVWWSEKKNLNEKSPGILKTVLSKWGVILFYVLILAMAYFEEALWDALIFREKSFPFGWTYTFLHEIQNSIVLVIVVPLLIMPQIVHYILDGYIWKNKQNKTFISPT